MDTIQEASTADQRKVPAELEALSIFLMPNGLITSLVPQAPSDPTLPTVEIPLTASRLAELNDNNAIGRSTPTSLDSALPSCRICGIPHFESVEKQREHVRLDWHRYNLKQQLLDKSAKPISEQQFENMIQDLSSISGSDDSSDEDSDNANARVKPAAKPSNDNDSITTGQDQEAMILSLMKKLELTVKQNQRARNQDPVLVHQQQLLEQQLQEARSSPMIWFTSSQYERTVRLGIYKNALPNKGQCDNIPEYLQTLQFPIVSSKKIKTKRVNREEKRAKELAAAGTHDVAPKPTPQEDSEEDEEEIVDQNQDWLAYQMQAKQLKQASRPTTKPRYWTLVLIGGGHFAGVVMDLAGQVSAHGRDMKVVAHKTFHRYTVRRKQGGSQAAHGAANSAGARIRMYNEEALKLEVRELLDSWSEWINQSECVFVHSPGNNRRVLFYDGSVVSTADKQGRLRSIPFMTRRPTLSELKRAYLELSTVKVCMLTQESLAQQDHMEQKALEKAIEASKTKTDNPSVIPSQEVIPEAPVELLKLIELIKKGRADAASSHLFKHGMDASTLLPLTTSTEYDMRRTPTLLHLASHHGQSQVVKILLEKHNADPTVTSAGADQGNDESDSGFSTTSLTAYDVAKDKETRNAFRRAMALMPDNWDWMGLAHVPSALTPEMEAEQERKAKEKTKKLLDAERERKKTREARPTTPANKPASSPSSSSSSPSLMSKNLASASAANSHLSPELRMRLERERRANAAEARMAAVRQNETIRRAVQDGKHICVACGTSLENKVPFDKFGRKFCTTECVAKGPV
ncbi:hypothetical protein BG003_000088 [Podila horticola]|nr:hypothetical protein BG003_000083 [Podila horticola]KAF9321707.1 hypothetical protein BG003_000088 [Podila horticola]